APGLVVLPEVFNSNTHIREVADGYAEDGYIALAPDVYWRQEAAAFLPYTDDGRARAQSLRARLDTDQFCSDLGDVITALRTRDDCSGRVAVLGFCLGGKFTYLASVRHRVDAAVSYYGVQIDEHLHEADSLDCPLLLHFAQNDPHIPESTLKTIRERLGNSPHVQIHVYPDTEHGFNRFGHPPYNAQQAALARERTLTHLRTHL
ncbi:MAG: dienelactone hydrolase family protein, partial [Gammaproteobacteria bacterium]|nr:dienelactone hydrolase family protein [Gammaproteobacteria bacterium]